MKKPINAEKYDELNDKYEILGQELYSYIKKKGKHKRAEKKSKNR